MTAQTAYEQNYQDKNNPSRENLGGYNNEVAVAVPYK